jgi:hypothetical protein
VSEQKQTTKRCHWVSQSYLRTFAADPDTRRKIWRLSKDRGDPELKLIEKVAVKFHLYAPKGPDGRRDDWLEKKLADLETLFGTPTWDAVCTDFQDLSWTPLRQMLALLVATTYMRNPRQFEQMKHVHGELVNLISSGSATPGSIAINGVVQPVNFDNWPDYRNASEEDLKRVWGQEVSTAGWLAEMLLKMRWGIVFSEEPVFITSDNPVIISHPSHKIRGFKNPETSVIFPLSPTRILTMDNRQGEPDGQYRPLRQAPGSLNCLIWHNAIEHMFAPRHPDIICGQIFDAEQSLIRIS